MSNTGRYLPQRGEPFLVVKLVYQLLFIRNFFPQGSGQMIDASHDAGQFAHLHILCDRNSQVSFQICKMRLNSRHVRLQRTSDPERHSYAGKSSQTEHGKRDEDLNILLRAVVPNPVHEPRAAVCPAIERNGDGAEKDNVVITMKDGGGWFPGPGSRLRNGKNGRALTRRNVFLWPWAIARRKGVSEQFVCP